jgi:L-serine dehydratase
MLRKMVAFTSTFELFKLGVGPSSSHTMGPMTASFRFTQSLIDRMILDRVARVSVRLYGSLALTGRGHATDRAVMLGLSGQQPVSVDPREAQRMLESIQSKKELVLGARKRIPFDLDQDLEWRFKERLDFHPNGLTLIAVDEKGAELLRETYFSVGGGFVVSEAQARVPQPSSAIPVPFAYASADELLELCRMHNTTIAEIMRRNECALRSSDEVDRMLDEINSAMSDCIERGLYETGILPGGLNVKRRAATLRETLERQEQSGASDPLRAMDWINAWALAVNEENAAGGRVVTAPTNGAAGVIPAVLRYYLKFCDGNVEGARTFLLTAAAVGNLYKRNASISAAEVGCQGEIGVACSMAAAGLTAVRGGTNEQIENAAEIGMEHNLGLTCDPIRGLVQIPCIERNATGAVKAIDASRLALHGDGTHHVSLDQVIETMRRTGADMRESYKETSLAGLAVNVPEC